MTEPMVNELFPVAEIRAAKESYWVAETSPDGDVMYLFRYQEYVAAAGDVIDDNAPMGPEPISEVSVTSPEPTLFIQRQMSCISDASCIVGPRDSERSCFDVIVTNHRPIEEGGE